MKPDLFARIRALGKLTRTQTKMVNLFNSSPNLLAFENLSALSQRANVSKASMVRFLIHILGYRDFAEFQTERQDAMALNLDSPIMRFLKDTKQAPEDRAVVDTHIPYTLQAIQQAYGRLDLDSFNRMADILTQTRRPLHLMGHRTAFSLAYMMFINLQYIRPRVFLLGGAHPSMPAQIFNVEKKDVVLAISRRRYSKISLEITRKLKELGTTLLLVTDSEVAPLSGLADVQLVVTPSSQGGFESITAWAAILEALTLTVADACRKAEPGYSQKAEELLDSLFGFLEH
ncbi:MurR/RpiR family transcriptional regulator [Desulfotignum balticum]|uniref:MurR/RpiR family transcriptional regulator n=1 Tax=Desulfotignum balticum TaxID=115781 RepID=UPI00041A6B5D|nr:MurR/RpiR family transcriptional regulator [Desulfotignum balticum]